MGCAGSALIAACLAVETDAWRAAAAGLLCSALPANWRQQEAKGPASFAVAIIDALYALDGADIDPARAGEMMDVDLSLYAIVDPSVAGGRTLADLARSVAGSATLVQMRDKHASTRAMVEEARAIQAALNASRVPLLVNDRVDVALAAEADGVHIGQDDMAAAEARLLLGRSAIIGLSVKSDRRGAGRAARASRLCRCRRRVRDHVQGRPPTRRSASMACARSSRPCAPARLHFRSAPSLASPKATRRGHRRRRRRRRGDFGAVAGARSGRRAEKTCAPLSTARWRSVAAHDRDCAHHCRFGFERRRRHPGGSEDFCRARRLWRDA